MDYYKVHRVSATMLKALSGEVKTKASQQILNFGIAFHAYLLEPEKFDKLNVSANDKKQIKEMVEKSKVLEHPIIQVLNQHGTKEADFYWTHKGTGVECKSRIDLHLHPVISDYKTTFCADDAAFRRFVSEYYMNQAAFYLEATGAETFYFFGVRKTFPFKYFVYGLHSDSLAIKKYKKRNAELLQIFKNLPLEKQIEFYEKTYTTD